MPFLIFLSILLAGVAGYVAGFKTGPERERQRSEMRFRVSVGLRLLHSLETGDTNKALGDVRFVLWGDTLKYERIFGAPASSDSFAPRFDKAKAATAQVESTLVPVAPALKALIGTNDITIENK